MLLDQHDFNKRSHFYQLNRYTTVHEKWQNLPTAQQKAIRLAVDNALDASVYSSPRNISSFLLERLGIWVSAEEVQGALLSRDTAHSSPTQAMLI